MLIVTDQPLDLQSTLASGQTFRWRQVDGWFEGVVFSNLVRVRPAPEGIEFLCDPDDEERVEPLLRSYFRLEEDIEAIYASIEVDERVIQSETDLPDVVGIDDDRVPLAVRLGSH